MVLDDKNVLLTEFVNGVKNLESQKRILNGLNEVLKIYPSIIKSNEEMLFQMRVARKYVKNSVFNGTSSLLCAYGALGFSDYFLDLDVSNFKCFASAFLISLLGFAILQKDNKKSYLENSLDIEKVFESASEVDRKFNAISSELISATQDYVNTSCYYIDEFLENDVIRDIFLSNNDYIESKKVDGTFESGFGYESVCDTFNELFGFTGGFSEYISTNCEIVYEDDLVKSRKRL